MIKGKSAAGHLTLPTRNSTALVQLAGDYMMKRKRTNVQKNDYTKAHIDLAIGLFNSGSAGSIHCKASS
jgi:hypothetical protein